MKVREGQVHWRHSRQIRGPGCERAAPMVSASSPGTSSRARAAASANEPPDPMAAERMRVQGPSNFC